MREKFDPQIVTGRLLDCYERLIAQRAPAAGPIAPEAAVTPSQMADTATTLARLAAPPRPHQIEGARTRAVLAFADELVADPSLLAAWAAEIDGRDDVTLVIYAPDWSPHDAGARLGAAVTHAGLDGEDAADLLALATPATLKLETQLAAGASAILSRRVPVPPFAALPTICERSIGRLHDASHPG
jgi:hypothetical protein